MSRWKSALAALPGRAATMALFVRVSGDATGHYNRVVSLLVGEFACLAAWPLLGIGTVKARKHFGCLLPDQRQHCKETAHGGSDVMSCSPTNSSES